MQIVEQCPALGHTQIRLDDGRLVDLWAWGGGESRGVTVHEYSARGRTESVTRCRPGLGECDCGKAPGCVHLEMARLAEGEVTG